MTGTNTPAFAVLKFGGSSVATAPRWERIARVVAQSLESGEHPVVACSALAGVTDALESVVAAVESGLKTDAAVDALWAKHVALAEDLGVDVDAALGSELADLRATIASAAPGQPTHARWRARILATGELMSTRLGAAFLQGCGLAVRWVDARTLLRAEPAADTAGGEAYLSARCAHVADETARARLTSHGGVATITQGFIARNADGETVLLGRGGSDTSAAYLAVMLDAARLEVWTDVPGMFTADPRRVDRARLLRRITYEEASVLGSLGAKILHPRCLMPASDRGILLGIRWTDRPEVPGTLVGRGPEFESPGIKAVTSRDNLCLVRMRRELDWQPVGFMSDVSRCFQDQGLSMDLISSSPAEIRATVDLDAHPDARDRLPDLVADLGRLCQPTVSLGMASVSVAGSRISEEMPRIAGVLELLGAPAVHLVSHAADDTHVSYVVDAAIAAELLLAVHDTIFAADVDHSALGPVWRELAAAPAPTPPALHRPTAPRRAGVA
jgi:diaminopimelate decarboxylase/aspartate kinase